MGTSEANKILTAETGDAVGLNSPHFLAAQYFVFHLYT